MADLSPSGREKSASSGHALPDGSYPIETERDLKNAIQAIGRAKNRAQVRAHIIQRAKALGKTDLLPDDWEIAASAEPLELATGGGYWSKVPKPKAGKYQRPAGRQQRPGEGAQKRSGSSGGSGKQRVVRTTKGALYYGAPIGTPIVRDEKTGKMRAVKPGKAGAAGKVKGAAKKKLTYEQWDKRVSAAFKKIRRLVKQYPEFDLVDGPKKGRRGSGGGDSGSSGTVGGSYSGGARRSSGGGFRRGSGGSSRRSGSVGGSYSGGARRSGGGSTRPQESMIKTQIARVESKLKSKDLTEEKRAAAQDILARWRDLLELVRAQPKSSGGGSSMAMSRHTNEGANLMDSAVDQDEAILLAGCSLNVSPKPDDWHVMNVREEVARILREY